MPASRRLERFFIDCWYRNHHRLAVFSMMPLSWLFRGAVFLRRKAYAFGLCNVHRLPVPVVVVGNLTVGGTGKTPLVMWLVDFLKKEGFTPCVISRGYGGMNTRLPQQVRPDSDPVTVGDEALLLARHCSCPVAVSPDRVSAARALLEHERCDIMITDDGLQHYALGRDIEIMIVDGIRRFGNGLLLPAGPLREPRSRKDKVDLVVCNGLASRGEFGMKLTVGDLRAVADNSITRPAREFRGKAAHAVAGIGNPDRFFSDLRKLGVTLIEHEFPDHYAYAQEDICFDDELDVVMTEKDAVKCRRFAGPNHWYLPVKVELHEHFGHRLLALLKEVKEHG